MDFFNVGTGELLFLVLLAILLIGPRRAVELVQQVRRLVASLQQEWEPVRREVVAEMQALQQETLAAVGPPLKEELQGIATEVQAREREVLAERSQAQPQAPVDGEASSPPEVVGSGGEMAG